MPVLLMGGTPMLLMGGTPVLLMGGTPMLLMGGTPMLRGVGRTCHARESDLGIMSQEEGAFRRDREIPLGGMGLTGGRIAGAGLVPPSGGT
jgi:hypothetical protein